MAEQVIWGIHVTGSEGDKLFRERSMVGIGWHEVGDLSKIAPDREAFKTAVAPFFPNKPRGYIINAASQLYRFRHEMKVADWIVYRSTYFDGKVHVGKIVSDYRFNPTESAEYPNIRQVQWSGSFLPTRVPQAALYELGSALTLFQLANYGREFLAALEASPTAEVEADDDETVALKAEEVGLNTEDFIIRALARNLKGHGLQGFVADLLRTMGYRTSESKPGPDEGVDIIAHRDELKLLPPIIKVQVKSGAGNVGREVVQALLGNLSQGEYGLLITIGGFANTAREFSKTKNSIRLIDGPALVELVLEHYEELQPRYKAMIPLKRVYIPQPATEAVSA
jgi:restriction system protein